MRTSGSEGMACEDGFSWGGCSGQRTRRQRSKQHGLLKRSPTRSAQEANDEIRSTAAFAPTLPLSKPVSDRRSRDAAAGYGGNDHIVRAHTAAGTEQR
eukprot:COSAG06_NODE_22562_length_719_cov_1.679032_2_plen_97_part_01